MPELDPAARQAIERELARVEDLVRAVASRPPSSAEHGWRRAELRPVAIRGRTLVQLTFAGTSASRTVNVEPGALAEELERLFAMRFANWVVNTARHTLTVRVLKRRTAVHRAVRDHRQAVLTNDRPRRRLVDPASAPFLTAVGIAGGDGTVRASMAGKLRQVEEFVRSVDDLVGGEPLDRLRIVDFGCGRASLTFALYHHFAEVRRIPTTLVGVDRDPALVARSGELAATLGWRAVSFREAAIDAYEPDVAPDLVVSLHACDTATDDALGRAVAWGARWIVAVPCCHHHLQVQLRRVAAPAGAQLVRQHGILFERLGDLLTDGFRASLLKLCRYDAEVHEFVEPERTSRNVMIRARRHDRPGPASVRAAYDLAKETWQVEPYLEHLVDAHLS